MQRWETGKARPYGDELAQLARHVHPHDATVAAEIAAAIGQSLESLGIVAPARPPAASPPAAPPVAPAMPRHLAVDAVVCVAAEAPRGDAGRRPRHAAQVRSAGQRELGLSCDEVERALDDALRPAPPAAAAAAAATAKAEPRPAKAT